MFTIHSLYVHYMFTIYSLYVHYIFTIYYHYDCVILRLHPFERLFFYSNVADNFYLKSWSVGTFKTVNIDEFVMPQ